MILERCLNFLTISLHISIVSPLKIPLFFMHSISKTEVRIFETFRLGEIMQDLVKFYFLSWTKWQIEGKTRLYARIDSVGKSVFLFFFFFSDIHRDRSSRKLNAKRGKRQIVEVIAMIIDRSIGGAAFSRV